MDRTKADRIPVRSVVDVQGHRSIHHSPENTKRWPNVGLMLVQRLRRWANINPTLGERLVSASLHICMLMRPETSHMEALITAQRRRWVIAGTTSTMLARYCADVYRFPRRHGTCMYIYTAQKHIFVPIIKSTDHSMYVSGFSCTPVAFLYL